MRNQFTDLKILFVFVFFSLSLSTLAQVSFPETMFYYSKSPNGAFGDEKIAFEFDGETLKITDYLLNTKQDYGPLEELRSSFIENGYFLIRFFPKYPRNKLLAYEFIFDKKGGNILAVRESRPKIEGFTEYLTEKGYKIRKGN